MLEAAWETHATTFANSQTSQEFVEAVQLLIDKANIDIKNPANVVYARDTRPTGPALVAALEVGLKAIGAQGRNEGVKTTPVLHYLVRCINSKGTKDAYGEDSEEGYMKKLSDAFKTLIVGVGFALSPSVFTILCRLVKHLRNLLLSIAPTALEHQQLRL